MAALSRRMVVKGGLGVAAAVGVAAVGREAAAAADERALPETLHRTRNLVSGTHTLEAGEVTPTHLSVVGTDTGRIRVRTSAGWSDWRSTATCPGGRETGRSAAFVSLPHDTVEYELRLAQDAVVSELNTLDGPAAGRLGPSSIQTTVARNEVRQTYLSRAAWGADESLRFDDNGAERFPAAYFPVQTLTVHHTAMRVSANTRADLRAIYYDHTITREFGDIGYHLLIDPSGQVYEGRWSGGDPVPVFGPDLGSDGRPMMSNAAHVAGFNAGNVGVCLLGDFTTAGPTARAVDSLVVVLAALSAGCGLDPTGRTEYVNPISGSKASVDTISGHRDWLATECPGEAFYPDLDDIRTRVARLMGR